MKIRRLKRKLGGDRFSVAAAMDVLHTPTRSR